MATRMCSLLGCMEALYIRGGYAASGRKGIPNREIGRAEKGSQIARVLVLRQARDKKRVSVFRMAYGVWRIGYWVLYCVLAGWEWSCTVGRLGSRTRQPEEMRGEERRRRRKEKED
ncbi:hypothetical protein F4809DRAFT_477287 [Biscogniauxia mediterranea]|nr:hypothetical protein F4809DRAFT_477287 [Biscogniauxia mediterranea]